MAAALEQHQIEIERNRIAWERKPLLRRIYAEFYAQIASRINREIPGRVVELGSGMGNLRGAFPDAICTDLFLNPWLDLVCDAYCLPFGSGSVSHLILFDVFHHLERPAAFLHEAAREIARGGRVILFEPFISVLSAPVYGLAHHEPIAWSRPISTVRRAPEQSSYYAAQGNATRVFFRGEMPLPTRWRVAETKAFATFAYFLSGGLSKPAVYPAPALSLFRRIDALLSHAPALFGGRCLVVLERD